MELKRNRLYLPMLWMVALSLLQVGCQREGSVEGGTSKQGLVGANRVQPSDLSYMRGLAVRQHGSVVMDLSDDTQYRFLRARMAAAGKTPAESPQFFSMLESLRQRHMVSRQGVHTQMEINTASRDHMVGNLIALPGNKSFEVAAFSTVQGGADYNFLDVVVWNEDQSQQLSDYGWSEVYGDGRKLWARATGRFPAKTDELLYVDSASIVSVNGTDEVLFKSALMVAAPGCDVVHPVDLVPTSRKDGIVTICLDRNNGDCDYPLVGYREVQIPLQGTMTFPFPVRRINNTADTFAKLVEENGGSHEMNYAGFFPELSINPQNPRQVQWSVPQHRGVFKELVFRPYEDVDLFMSIDVTMERGGTLTNAVRGFSSSPTRTPGSVCLPKIQLAYSCLAKGTQIQLADGKSAAIETIAKGSRVLTDDSGLTLNVSDTSVGIERIPMIRLRDTAGHDLLLTGSHPVITPDRGVVWARELAVGDKVYTQGGVSTLVRAEPEQFGGSVHNLKLDTSALSYTRFAQGSSMYANGFMVGDLSMQHAYEFKDAKAQSTQLLARLPARWHMDYRNSLKQGSSSTLR